MPTVLEYLDFDLLIERREDHYRARVIDSPAGQAIGDFSLPFSPLELENFFLRIGRPRQVQRQFRLSAPAQRDYVRDFGTKLYEAVFNDEMRACLRASLDQADQQGKGLRIRLRLAEAPALNDLPWEYLHNPALNRFLSLSVETPLVRYLDLAERIRPLAVQPPFRALVMISDPSDVAVLDVEQEWARLKGALRNLEERGLLVVDRLDKATLPALQSQLRQADYHIFHYIGHGDYDPRTQDGMLLLEDEQGKGRPISGVDLGVALHDARALRLAVLNACEGARTSATDPFAGTAQSLVQAGIPAVIAMQFEITDEAAITFAQEFYTALVDGYPVDAALAEARKAIYLQGNEMEWGTPVLHMRAPEGVLFAVQGLPLQGEPLRAKPLTAPVRAEEAGAQGAREAVRPAAAQHAAGEAEQQATAQAPAQRVQARPAEAAAGQGAAGTAAPASLAPRQASLAERYPFLRGWKFWSALGGALAVVILFLALRPAIWPAAPTPTPALSPTPVIARPTFTPGPTREATVPAEQVATATLPSRRNTPTLPPPTARPTAAKETAIIGPTAYPEIFKLAPGAEIELVRVPAGKFTMGSNDADPDATDHEKPPHTVYLDEYLIGMHEVTVAQFRAFVQDTGHRSTAEVDGWSYVVEGSESKQERGLDWLHPYRPDESLLDASRGDDPVTHVSWDDAEAFCRWARNLTGIEVRLPTEAEWEKAARGEDGRIYPWGNDWDERYANTAEGGAPDVAKGGSYPRGASPYGALDMAGNVWEWVNDWYGKEYYRESPESNPPGPLDGMGRVLRGGSWGEPRKSARCASRQVMDTTYRDHKGGFRVVVVTGRAKPAPTKAAKEINLNLGMEPEAIDPALATDSASIQCAELLFLGLTDYDDETSEVIPELASEWIVSADGLTWTFRMRQDAQWVQYDPATKTTTPVGAVTAHDVVYGIQRTINPETGSQWAYLDYVIQNAEAINKGENKDLGSLGVRALDDYTVEFRLAQPAGYFAGIVGMWFNRPQPRAAIEAGGTQWTEPGNIWTNGPYVLDTWEHRHDMVFTINQHYYGAKDVDIGRINADMVSDGSSALFAYARGELDIAAVAAGDIDTVRADVALSKELHAAPHTCTYYYGFNTTKPPFDNARVRQAFSYAIDRQQLVDVVLKGQGLAATSFGGPGILGSPAEDRHFEGMAFHPSRPRALLADAGYPDGRGLPEITIAFNTGENHRVIAEFLQQSYKENLGIEVKLASEEWPAYLKALRSGDAAQIYRISYCAEYPDENSLLMSNLHTTRSQNYSRWSGPAAESFDRLVEQAAAIADPQKRANLYLEAEKILVEDQAVIMPIYYYSRMVCSKPYVQRTYAPMGNEHIDKWKMLPH